MKNIKIIMISLLLGMLFFAACSDQKKERAKEEVKTDVKYTCPMHPQIMEDHPGSCPICGMALVKKSGQASEGSGISLTTVLQPVNSTVLSTISLRVFRGVLKNCTSNMPSRKYTVASASLISIVRIWLPHNRI
jgi:hypothetical protein